MSGGSGPSLDLSGDPASSLFSSESIQQRVREEKKVGDLI